MNLRWKVAQFFEINWWKNYLGNRDKTEYLAWKRAYWTEFLQKSDIAVPKGSRVLDAGCGPAGIFMVLPEIEVDALDPLLEQYEKSLPHFDKADYPNVRFINSALENFQNEKPYDVVFCLNAINHVSDLGLCFEKLADLTASTGILALSIDAHKHSFLKPLFRLFPGDVLHPHQYDLKEYQAMVEQSGFSIKNTILVKEDAIFDYYLIVAERA